MTEEQQCTGFVRLAQLLQAGYRFQSVTGAECAFLEHPAGRKFGQWRLMVYDTGTVVGMPPAEGQESMRIKSFDQEHFRSFLRSVPQHTGWLG